MFVFKGDGIIQDFYGTYSEFNNKQKEDKKEIKSVKKQKNNSVKKQENRNVSYKEKYEYGELEKEISILEKEKEILEKSLLKTNLEVEIIIKNSKRLSDVVSLIDEKSFRWMELDELM